MRSNGSGQQCRRRLRFANQVIRKAFRLSLGVKVSIEEMTRMAKVWFHTGGRLTAYSGL